MRSRHFSASSCHLSSGCLVDRSAGVVDGEPRHPQCGQLLDDEAVAPPARLEPVGLCGVADLEAVDPFGQTTRSTGSPSRRMRSASWPGPAWQHVADADRPDFRSATSAWSASTRPTRSSTRARRSPGVLSPTRPQTRCGADRARPPADSTSATSLRSLPPGREVGDPRPEVRGHHHSVIGCQVGDVSDRAAPACGVASTSSTGPPRCG